MRFSILIVSDSAYNDRNLDKSGPLLIDLLNSSKIDSQLLEYNVVPDEKSKIVEFLRDYSPKCDCILTSGGTGFSKRDVTPEATKEIIEKECPGIVAAILNKGMESTPFAALTRLTAGIVGNCLIINLPGSPKAVKESFQVLEPILSHAISVIKGDVDEIVKIHGERK